METLELGLERRWSVFAVGGKIIAVRMQPVITLVYVISQGLNYSQIKVFFILHVGVIETFSGTFSTVFHDWCF